jgi:DNA topoisomerase-3
MVTKVLCVAEKPSIAKAVANHLSGGNVQTVSLWPPPNAFNGIDHV